MRPILVALRGRAHAPGPRPPKWRQAIPQPRIRRIFQFPRGKPFARMFLPKILHEFGRFQVFAWIFLPTFLQEFGQFWNFVQIFVPNFLHFFRELIEAFLRFLICLTSTKTGCTFFWSSMKVGIGKGDKENGREGKGRHGDGIVLALLLGTKTTTPLSKSSFSGLSANSDPNRGVSEQLSPSTICWEGPWGEYMAATLWCIPGGSVGRPNFLGILRTTPGGKRIWMNLWEYHLCESLEKKERREKRHLVGQFQFHPRA